MQEGNEGVRITRCPPSLAELVSLEAMRCAVPVPYDPQEDVGGCWLDPHRFELIDHALWDNLECIKKQHIWHGRSVAKRQAKRRCQEDDKMMYPFVPSTSLTNTVAGPSNHHNTPATPTVPPPPPPIPPTSEPPAPVAGDEDEEMTDGNTKEHTDRARGKDKGVGCIPKK